MRGDRLRKLRKERNLTQEELARKLNMTHTSISGYERGERFPDTDTLARLADELKTTADYLLGRTNKPFMESSMFDKENYTFIETKGLSERDIELIRGLTEDMRKYSVSDHTDMI